MCFEFEHSSKTEVGKSGESPVPSVPLQCRCNVGLVDEDHM